jgi:hypothetical protein
MADPQSDDIFGAWGRALDADPSVRRRGFPQGAQDATGASGGVTPPQQQEAPPAAIQRPAASGEAIASTAAKLVGNNSSSILPFLRQTGQSLDATRSNWCAAFVNGVLGANGVEGTQGSSKNVATSFLNWGAPAEGEPQPGDVLVQPRGHPAGGIGGHVGIATGQVAEGAGQTYYLMQSGNLNGKVAYSWEPAHSVVIRRAPPKPTQAQQ